MSKPIIGHSDIANFFLDNEVNVNTRDSDKWSPLISAAKHGDADLVHNLLRAGALQNEDENEIVDMVPYRSIDQLLRSVTRVDYTTHTV